MFGEEALVKLLSMLTEPEYLGKMVVILAGYEQEMQTMMQRNVGLKSRFQEFIAFPDWTAARCTEFVFKSKNMKSYQFGKSEAEKKGIELDLQNGFETIRSRPGWANARDANRMCNLIESEWAIRLSENEADRSQTEMIVYAKDVQTSIQKFINSRPIQDVSAVEKHEHPLLPMNFGFMKDVIKNQTQDTKTNELLPNAEIEKAENIDKQECKDDDLLPEKDEKAQSKENKDAQNIDGVRDKGVSDEIWKKLLRAKLAHEEEMRKKTLEELRKEERIQEKLRQLALCPAGFQWFKVGNGYRCGGGSHYCSDQQLQDMFTF